MGTSTSSAPAEGAQRPVRLDPQIQLEREPDQLHGEPAVHRRQRNQRRPGPELDRLRTAAAVRLQTSIAVDKSNSLRAGYIYVDTGNVTGNVDIFDPTGKYVTSFKASPGMHRRGRGRPRRLRLRLCGQASTPTSRNTTPRTYLEVERINDTNGENESLRERVHRPLLRPDPSRLDRSGVDGMGRSPSSTANAKVSTSASGRPTSGRTNCWPASAPTPSPKTGFESPLHGRKVRNRKLSGQVPPAAAATKKDAPSSAARSEGHTFEVDPKTNELYLVSRPTGKRSSPTARAFRAIPSIRTRPAFGEGHLETTGQGVAIDNSGNVYTTIEPNKVVKFTRGATLPNVLSKPTAITDEGHTEATVRGVIDPAGGGEITSCKVAWGETAKHLNAPVSCKEATPYPGSGTKEVSATFTGLPVGHLYHFRFEAANASGTGFGSDRIFETKAVLSLETKPPTNVDENNATLQGQFDADGQETTYWYEFGPDSQLRSADRDTESHRVAWADPPGSAASDPSADGPRLPLPARRRRTRWAQRQAPT